MRGGLGAGTSAADGLAIQGNRFIGGGDQGRLYPGGEEGFQRGYIEAREQPAIVGTSGTGKATWAEEAAQPQVLGAAPLPHRFAVIAIAEQSRDKTGEQEWQVIAPSMAGAGIGNSSEDLMKSSAGQHRPPSPAGAARPRKARTGEVQ